MRRKLRVGLVWALVVLMSIDTALACRFLARRRAVCRPVYYTYCPPCPVVYAEPACCSPAVQPHCEAVTDYPSHGSYRETDNVAPPPPPEEALPEEEPDAIRSPGDRPRGQFDRSQMNRRGSGRDVPAFTEPEPEDLQQQGPSSVVPPREAAPPDRGPGPRRDPEPRPRVQERRPLSPPLDAPEAVETVEPVAPVEPGEAEVSPVPPPVAPPSGREAPPNEAERSLPAAETLPTPIVPPVEMPEERPATPPADADPFAEPPAAERMPGDGTPSPATPPVDADPFAEPPATEPAAPPKPVTPSADADPFAEPPAPAPMPATPPADADPFAEPPKEAMPADEAPSPATPPADVDPFAEPPATTPMPVTPPADADPFAEPAATPPADADPFSEPATEAMPADEAAPPATPSADADPFAEPPATPSPTTPPDTAEPPADADPFAEPPAATPPATAPGDVDPFAEPPATTSPPANDPFAPAGEEEMPAETATPPAATSPDAEDPFAPPGGSETPASTEADPFAPPAATPAPATEEDTPPADDDDPFGAVTSPKPAVAADQLRTWNDNTGTFEVRGQLVQILDGKVRLLKETGKFTTVPLRRLSADDLEFVRQVAAAWGSPELVRTAQR